MRRWVSVTEVLDAGAETVSGVAAPWLGVLWLTALPLRMLQAHLAALLIELGDTASGYADHLTGIASLGAWALLLSLWGRAVFIRACGLSQGGRVVPGREAVRLRSAAFAGYLYVALVLELLSFAFAWTLAAPMLLAVLAGLAAALSPLHERPSLLAPLTAFRPYSGVVFGSLLAVALVFGLALLLVAINLAILFQIGLWLAGAVPGLDLAPWRGLLAWSNLRFRLVLVAGTVLAVEPFWLGACAAFVARVRARESGEDLRLWLARLTSAAALLVLVVAGPARAQEPLSAAAYRAELERIEAALHRRDVETARSEARQLLGARVDYGNETLATDRSVLAPVTGSHDAAAMARAATRVRAQMDALTSILGAPVPAPDPALLERLRAEEAPRLPEKGGQVAGFPLRPPTLPERVTSALEAAWQWLGEQLRKLLEWLWQLLPRRTAAQGSPFATNLATLAIVAVITAALGVLALRALRRRRPVAPIGESTAVSSARDADPLSRGAEEWQAYARKLAAAGRTREAIRALYHAVLVTLFRSGILHHQKGRTNWEYVARISPEAGWRPALVALTRTFDREWYGHEASAREAFHECLAAAGEVMESVHEEPAA